MRRLVTLGTPVAFALMSLAHPRPGPTAAATLAPQVGLWIAVHVAQLVLIPLTGLAVWLLIEDLPGLAPAVSRCALVFFVAFYAAFDALVGIGTGILLRQASGLTGADGQLAMRIAQGFWDGRLDPSGPILWVTVIGDLAWIVALLAAALAQPAPRASASSSSWSRASRSPSITRGPPAPSAWPPSPPPPASSLHLPGSGFDFV